MSIKEIKNKPWVYRLFSTENGYILSVVFCNGYVDFSRAFKVEINSLNDDYLAEKAKEISENYEKYRSQEVDLPE